MPRTFCYDRRFTYFDHQDYAPDMRFACMRWSGPTTSLDDLADRFDRALYRVGKVFYRDRARPDRKRMKKGHR